MKKESNYEKTRKILEDNIIRLMMEKNLTARALSIRIVFGPGRNRQLGTS